MTDHYPKRLIEVDLPIKRISAHSRREKSIRHGHISTLHIWWARRPLAACRAVICASLWPDPADNLCPDLFRKIARERMTNWARKHLNLVSEESWARFMTISQDERKLDDLVELRAALLDFIADFSNWDNSTVPEYLETSRLLTQTAHEALGGEPGSRPLVVDPFAGGGAIPMEALRVGANAFASDLNPVAVLLNKVVLEYIPKYGKNLAVEVRKWGQWVKVLAEQELAEFYPRDPDGSMPIAFLWARTIQCEGPGCGAAIPLLGRSIIAQREKNAVGIQFLDELSDNKIQAVIVNGLDAKETKATCKGFVATCPLRKCSYSTPKKNVQRQLTNQQGGADHSKLLAILTDGPKGRRYRMPNDSDLKAVNSSVAALKKCIDSFQEEGSLIPGEPIPSKLAHRAVGSQLPLYGFKSWGDLFTSRQKLSISVLQRLTREAYLKLCEQGDEQFARAVFILLAFALDKQADYSSSLCRWVSKGEFIAGTLAGEKKLAMISDFAESNPIGNGSGSWGKHIDWISRFFERECCSFSKSGIACQSSADEQLLPSDSAAAMITDPPYYDSVPYADLSDFYFVWLKRTLRGIENLSESNLSPKTQEMTVNHPSDQDEKIRYESLLTSAFAKGRDATSPDGIGVIVFAHKSTSGWETLIAAIIKSGWIVSASWPIDTERVARMNALRTASLTSSVHIVCRPRENHDGSVRMDDIGDWRDVLAELPKRIHEWMPRLTEEGVVGADAIFACIGPALEIYSRYSSVEKASGEKVELKEYLEEVWGAVSREALNMIFEGADASGFEEDARLTAMWLWTLRTAANGSEVDAGDDSEKTKSLLGFSLEYDAARKIAQGLGAHLEKLSNLVEINGDTAVLLSAAARTKYLFGKESAEAPRRKQKKKSLQLTLDFGEEFDQLEKESEDWAGDLSAKSGTTVLDQLHQSMILFAAGRGEAMKRFLVVEGVGRNPLFWGLAQALSALYPAGTDEKRWVDGVMARKKGLGL